MGKYKTIIQDYMLQIFQVAQIKIVSTWHSLFSLLSFKQLAVPCGLNQSLTIMQENDFKLWVLWPCANFFLFSPKFHSWLFFFLFRHSDKPLENHWFNRCGMLNQIFIVHSFYFFHWRKLNHFVVIIDEKATHSRFPESCSVSLQPWVFLDNYLTGFLYF